MTRSFSPHVRPETVRVLGAQTVTVVLTPRDKAILSDLVKHRALSSPWLARAHFGGSRPACWGRLRRLIGAGYVEKVETQPGEPKAYRATNTGKGALGRSAAGRPAKRARPAQLFHTMAVADVAALLLERLGRGSGGAAAPAAWRSEQELRGGGGAGWLPQGCYPDGVLEVADGAGGAVHRLAVEVELSRKEKHRYPPKLRLYRQALEAGVLDGVRWYVPTRTDALWLRREVLLPAGFPKEDDRVVITTLPEHARYGR